jgi:subtilisin
MNYSNILYQILRKVVLFCVVIVMINGIVTNGIVTKGMAAGTNRSVIIGFKHPVGPAEDIVIHVHGGEAKKKFRLIPVVAANVPENKIAEMKNDSRIAYIVNDTIFKMADEYSNSWGVQYIGSQPVHNQSINGTGVKIAVLDTGIDYNHPDLKDNYKGGFNFVNNNSDPWDDNCLSFYKTCHGTHVSGIIAAEHNGLGVVGVAPGASIYAVKVLDGGGFGTASTVLSGIEWAVNNHMDIISMSIESTENNTAVLDAVNAAYNSGVLLVAAGGNTGGGPVLYPAAYDSVIAVTAIDQNGQRASFSPIDQKIEVAAPGVNINSTVCIIADSSHCLQEGYGILSGTSMAAPHVTGVAALIYSTGKRDNKVVRQIIDNTAFDAGTPGKDDIYGYGIVDAQNATLGIPYIQIQLPTTYIPPNPTNLQNTRGNFWVNYTWLAGAGNITDSYNISENGIWRNGTVNTFENITTAPGEWANITVWGFNSSGKGSLSAGSINQSFQVPISITLLRTTGSPINNSKTVNLSQGNYSVIINNTNLSELGMLVYDNGTFRKDLSQKFEFNIPKKNSKLIYDAKLKNDSNNLVINLDIQNLLKVVFVPYGYKGTTCNVTIKQV